MSIDRLSFHGKILSFVEPPQVVFSILRQGKKGTVHISGIWLIEVDLLSNLKAEVDRVYAEACKEGLLARPKAAKVSAEKGLKRPGGQ